MKKNVLKPVAGTDGAVWYDPQIGEFFCNLTQWVKSAAESEQVASAAISLRINNDYVFAKHRIPARVLEAINVPVYP